MEPIRGRPQYIERKTKPKKPSTSPSSEERSSSRSPHRSPSPELPPDPIVEKVLSKQMKETRISKKPSSRRPPPAPSFSTSTTTEPTRPALVHTPPPPPFDRVISANQRALRRAVAVQRRFRELFNFEQLPGGRYQPDYRVTLKPDADGLDQLPIKKVLEVLQQYRRSHLPDKVLDVRINIGGENKGFFLKPDENQHDQIFINTLNSRYHYIARDWRTYKDGYDDAARILDQGDKVAISVAILVALNKPIAEQNRLFTAFSAPQKQAIMTLIAATQIAEACPGRTPGMNKLARASFQRIANNESTFMEEFNSRDGRYFPAHRGGTEKARTAIRTGRPPRNPKGDSFRSLSPSSGNEL